MGSKQRRNNLLLASGEARYIARIEFVIDGELSVNCALNLRPQEAFR
jgi:hypothetical protein